MSLLARFRAYEYPAPMHGQRQSLKLTAEAALELVLQHRDEVFGPGNDKVFGAGQWVRCESCVDALGFPSYHHRKFHEDQPSLDFDAAPRVVDTPQGDAL